MGGAGNAHAFHHRVAPQPFNLDLNSSAKGCRGVSFLPPLHTCCTLARCQQPWRLPPMDTSSVTPVGTGTKTRAEDRGPSSGAARHTCFTFTHFLSHLTQVRGVMENTAGSNDVRMLLQLISDLSGAPH